MNHEEVDEAFDQAQIELLRAITAAARVVSQSAEAGDRDALAKAGETALRLAGAYHSLMSSAFEISEE